MTSPDVRHSWLSAPAAGRPFFGPLDGDAGAGTPRHRDAVWRGGGDDPLAGANWRGGTVPGADTAAAVTLSGDATDPALTGRLELERLTVANPGAFDVTSLGTLLLQGRGSTVGRGATLRVNGTVAGGGDLRVAADATLEWANGCLALAGSVAVAGRLAMVSGKPLTLASDLLLLGVATQSAPVRLGGPGTLFNAGRHLFSHDGVLGIDMVILPGGGLCKNTPAGRRLTVTGAIENRGTIAAGMSGGVSYVAAGPVLNRGVIDMTACGTGGRVEFRAGGDLVNTGTVVLDCDTAGVGEAVVAAAGRLVNDGAIRVGDGRGGGGRELRVGELRHAGALELQRDLTIGGPDAAAPVVVDARGGRFAIAPGATLRLAGGAGSALIVDAATRLDGGGEIVLQGDVELRADGAGADWGARIARRADDVVACA